MKRFDTEVFWPYDSLEKLRIECRLICGKREGGGIKSGRRKSGRETDEDEDDEDDIAQWSHGDPGRQPELPGHGCEERRWRWRGRGVGS